MMTEVVSAGSQERRLAGLSQRTACKGFQSAGTTQQRERAEQVEVVEKEDIIVNPGARNNSTEVVAVGAGSPPRSSAKTRLTSHPCKAPQPQTKRSLVESAHAKLALHMQRMLTHTTTTSIISTWTQKNA